jgi:hypothetical protein
VAHGNSFWLSQSFKIENTGTDLFVNPSVEVYLTPNRMNWDSYHYLTTKSYTSTLSTFYTAYFSLGSVTVPTSVPTGVYYVALYLRDASDALLSNNSSWSSYGDQVRVVHCWTAPDYDSYLAMGSSWSTTSGTLGVYDCRVYRMYLYADKGYNFSLCANDGVGSYTSPGDGELTMYSSSGSQIWYIDGSSSCGYDASTLGTAYEEWSPPSTGYYYLKVNDFYAGDMTYSLAYRSSQDIFADGFESGNTSAWSSTVP